MLKLTFNKNSYHVPNTWEECTQLQFIQIIEATTDLFNGKINIFEFRIMVALIVTGLKPRRLRKAEHEMMMSENIYRIGLEITFPLRVQYEKATSVSKMNKQLRDQLTRFLPEELDQRIPQIKWALKAEKNVVPDFIFAANLIPLIQHRRNKLSGYSFNRDGNILTTSLTASQFIEAQTAYNEYIRSGNKAMLNLLVAILYCPGLYNGETAIALSRKIDWVTPEIMNAVFINFQAIQVFLTERTKFNLLFSGKPSKKAHHTNGLEAAVFSLLKSGVNNPEDMNLMKFLELLYNDLLSSVAELHRSEIPLDKIAEKTGLSIAKINEIL